MFPYILMIGVPILYAMSQPKAQTLEKFYKKQRIAVGLFFAIYLGLLMMRHDTVGTDLSSYQYYFAYYGNASWETIFSIGIQYEPANPLLSKLVYTFSQNWQIYLAIVSLLILAPIAYLYIRESENAMMTLSIFLIGPLFVMFFSGIRQSLAIAMMVPVYYSTKKKNLPLYCLAIFAGYLCHNSMLVAIPFYFLYHMRVNKNWLLVIIPGLIVCYVFNGQLFTLALKILGPRYTERYGTIQQTGAYMTLILYVIFAVYSFVIPDPQKEDADTVGLRNILLFSVILQFFAPLNAVAMRLNYYYILFHPIIMPKLANRYSPHNKQIAIVSRIVICVVFFAYFIYNGYTGEDILEAYPYRAFWSPG